VKGFWKRPWGEAGNRAKLDKKNLRPPEGDRRFSREWDEWDATRLFHGAVEADFVHGGEEVGFRKLTLDGECLGLVFNGVASDSGDGFDGGGHGIDAFLAAEVGSGDSGIGQLFIGLPWGGGGRIIGRFAVVSGFHDGLDRFFRVGLGFCNDGHGFAVGGDGGVFDTGGGLDDAVGAALTAVMHAFHGDGGFSLDEVGGEEKKNGKEGFWHKDQ
jgi:hypothetical protein